MSTRAGSRARGCEPPPATASSSTARRCSRPRPPGAIAQQPWFARDAVRTAATWAGAADAAADEAIRLLAERGTGRPTLERLAAGRIRAEQRHDRAVAGGRAGAAADDGTLTGEDAAHLRHAVADAARRLLDEAARACGSRPFATGGDARPRPARPRAVHPPAPAGPDRRARRRRGAGGRRMSVDPATFERMYREDEDPWGFATSAVRARRSTTGRSRRSATGASAAASSSGARSAC